MEAQVPVAPAPIVLSTVTPKAPLTSASPTTRAADPTTLDVHLLAKHQSTTVAGGAVAGTEDEDQAASFDGGDETMNAKQKGA